ncbi:MAG: hypothetical protein ACTHML_15060 [Ginsengibacter sp.]
MKNDRNRISMHNLGKTSQEKREGKLKWNGLVKAESSKQTNILNLHPVNA